MNEEMEFMEYWRMNHLTNGIVLLRRYPYGLRTTKKILKRLIAKGWLSWDYDPDFGYSQYSPIRKGDNFGEWLALKGYQVEVAK